MAEIIAKVFMKWKMG